MFMGFEADYSAIPRCQFIKVNGEMCDGPAMRGQKFCYFHKRWQQKRIVINSKRRQLRSSIDLPPLEDANSVQMALTQVIGLVLRNQIDHKTAALALYGLQTASANVKRVEMGGIYECFVRDEKETANVPLRRNLWHPQREKWLLAKRKAEAEAANAEQEKHKDQSPAQPASPPSPKDAASAGADSAVGACKPQLPLKAQVFRALVNQLPPDVKENLQKEIVEHGERLLSG